jgi:hypothetical protein
VEAINPSRVFAQLAKRGLVDRGRAVIGLTSAGRAVPFHGTAMNNRDPRQLELFSDGPRPLLPRSLLGRGGLPKPLQDKLDGARAIRRASSGVDHQHRNACVR